MCLAASEPKILRARSTATEAIETEEEPIWVSVRTFLATVKADWSRRSSWPPLFRRGADFPGDGVGLLDLAEDLGLADDHGVERGGYAEEVADGFALAELVEVRADGGGGDGEVFMQEAQEGGVASLLGAGVLQREELDAVAGGEDEAFADAGRGGEGAGGLGEAAAGMARRSRISMGAVLWLMPSRTSFAHGVGNLCTAESELAAQTARMTKKTELAR